MMLEYFDPCQNPFLLILAISVTQLILVQKENFYINGRTSKDLPSL